MKNKRTILVIVDSSQKNKVDFILDILNVESLLFNFKVSPLKENRLYINFNSSNPILTRHIYKTLNWLGINTQILSYKTIFDSKLPNPIGLFLLDLIESL